MRVLLAEDDAAFRALVTQALERDGHVVRTVADGAELLRALATHLVGPAQQRFDVVITDVRMPGRSGLEVMSGLRRTDQQTRFVLITAFGDADVHARARELGATAVLDKPFDLDDLRAVVNKLAA